MICFHRTCSFRALLSIFFFGLQINGRPFCVWLCTLYHPSYGNCNICFSIIFIGSLLSLTFAWNGIPKVIHVEQVTFLKKNRVHSMPVITRHYSLNTKQQTTNHNFKTANSNCCPLTRAAACFDYHVQRCSLTLSSFLHLTNQHLVTFHFRFTSVILGLLLFAQILCLCTMPLQRLFALLYFHVCIHAHCPLCLIS